MFLRPARDSRLILNKLAALASTVLLAGLATQGAWAQAPSIMAPGDTIVTGFSGVLPPTPPFPAGDPVDETFINLDGASMQIQRPLPAAPPSGQLIPSPTVFSAPAQTVGQVFAITLDDQQVPNIYLGATSAFGLQIVGPDKDGDGRPDRLKVGEADATFMAGQWGAGGAPGSIYRVDGTTGAISLFTSIGANAGPGLGDVVFDRASHQFFVSDLDTGLIYRLDWTGTIIDTFDHGVAGRPAHGLAPVVDDGSSMSVTDPAFNAEDPATWGYTQPERLVGGMAMHNGRLFYAVFGGLQIWSVGINLDGSFASDPRWEVDVAGLASTNAVTDMVFDGNGNMILAQRGAQRGSYDYSVFADPQQSAVVRYRREIPDDPATPSVWVPVADQYAIGFRPDGLNATGGVALGYGYDEAGRMHTGACNQFLWSTGDSLRDNPAIAAQLAPGGPAVVHGLQGNDKDLVRPLNDPPFSSYFTDYDGTYDDPVNQGHVGDVEIWQPCVGYTPPYFPPPTYIPPPRDTFDLSIEKHGFPCVAAQDSYFCGYTIRVKNSGTTPYWGPLTVEDWLPAVPPGAVMTFTPQPPWVCGAVGPDDYQCSYPPVFLMPGDGVDLTVVVKLPMSYKPCSLDNAVRIVWPLGWGDANPGDDFAFASATIPGKRCEPPKDQKTNLKIDKDAYPKVCIDTGTDWFCSWVVTITNAGPGVFNGPIEVTDTLSSGTALTASAPWACVPAGPSYTCTSPPTVINPGDSVYLWVTTSIAKVEQQRLGKCSIANDATISSPVGTAQNTVAADDGPASAEALTPGPNCEPIGDHSDLKLTKEAGGCIPYTFDDRKTYLCGFAITVKNLGPDAFNAPIEIHDTMTPAPLPPSPSFVPPICAPDGGGYTCTSPGPVFLPPNTSTGPLTVFVLVPDDGQTCHIQNTAAITSPVGPNLNTVLGNDSDTATLDIPSPRCQPTVLREKKALDSCPIELRKPGGGCCEKGQPWNGRSCGNAPAPQCPAGTTGIYPDCKTKVLTCPSGFTGIYPDCKKPLKPKPTCRAGYLGTYPNCYKPETKKCPAGTTGIYPDCKPIPHCPANTIGTYPNCTPILILQCPAGTTGVFPNCVQKPTQRPCPKGYTGTFWPDCKKDETPNIRGGITTVPLNNLPICPQGTTGIWPACTAIPK